MTDSPSVTWPSPAMTTLSSRRTQRTVVERILRGAWASAVLSAAAATGLFFFMSAILDYSSAVTAELGMLDRRQKSSPKKRTPPPRCPTYQQLDLLILVERSGSKLLALYHRTRRSGCRCRRHGRRRSVTLEQHGHHRAFRFFHKGELALAQQIDADEISQLHLSSRHQVRQRKHQVPFDRPLQVPRPVLRIGPLREQEVLHLRRAVEHELVRDRRHQHPLLPHPP